MEGATKVDVVFIIFIKVNNIDRLNDKRTGLQCKKVARSRRMIIELVNRLFQV